MANPNCRSCDRAAAAGAYVNAVADLELTHFLLVFSIAGLRLTHLAAAGQRFRK